MGDWTYFDGPDGIKITTKELILGSVSAYEETAIPMDQIEALIVRIPDQGDRCFRANVTEDSGGT